MAEQRRVVFIAATLGRTTGQRRYHIDPGCGAIILNPIAAFERGKYSAQEAGFKICRKCAWKLLHRKRPTCHTKEPAPGTRRCQLNEGHQGDHYVNCGPGYPVFRWPKRELCAATSATGHTCALAPHEGEHYTPHYGKWA